MSKNSFTYGNSDVMKVTHKLINKVNVSISKEKIRDLS